MQRDTGGSAFPRDANWVGDARIEPQPGMTLRDWFAGHALTGVLTNSDTWGLSEHAIAASAYELADAMLAARKGGE